MKHLETRLCGPDPYSGLFFYQRGPRNGPRTPPVRTSTLDGLA